MSRSRNCGCESAQTGSRTEPEQLTDEQWLLIADLFFDRPPSPQGGRPRVPARRCVEGILWILRTGARWKDLPSGFPSPATCWRRHRKWSEEGVWQQAWGRLVRKLDWRGNIDCEETMADGTFAPAKKGANALVRPNGAKVRRSCFSLTAVACRSPQKSQVPVLMK